MNFKRNNLYESIIRQDIPFFDKNTPGELNSVITTNIELVKLGIGYKVADFVNQSCRGMACSLLALLGAWKFSIAFVPLVPCIILCSTIMVAMIKKYTIDEMKAYANAGQIAQESLSSIRTIFAFCLQRKTIDNYSKSLVDAENISKKKGLITGLFGGAANSLFNCCFAIAIVYGSYLVRTNCKSYSPSNIVQSIFCIIATNVAFSQALPFLKDLAEAKGAAKKIFDLIEEKSSSISSNSNDDCCFLNETGEIFKKRLKNLNGDIKFENVCFSYPTRSNLKILDNLNLHLKANKTYAFVGHSGSGKSTVVSLLQRFYQANSGTITIDGQRIEDLDLKWLRRQMALVAQEPVLFSTSIRYV
jgi:ATP-binding cassette subfamily B (MDR/TAP) protein 1